jgi:hypothetical protein
LKLENAIFEFFKKNELHVARATIVVFDTFQATKDENAWLSQCHMTVVQKKWSFSVNRINI